MNIENPYFSVVIPLYNKAPHVARSINSVLSQTFADFEVIIVDDASTDNSVEEVEKFNDKRIRIFHREQPGPGGYAARNLGIKEATANWVAFLDADDEWLPDHLERMRELIIQYPEVNIIGCGWRNSMNGSFCENAYYRRYDCSGSHMIDASQYLSLCLAEMRPIHTSLACINKNSPVASNLFPSDLKAKRGGDLHAWLKMICYHKIMAWSNHIGAFYYRDSVNMVTKSAPWSPVLMSKAVYEEFSVRLNKTEKKALKKYLNYELGNAWKGNYNTKNETFSMWNKLYWRGDLVRAIYLFFLSVTPRGLLDVLNGARKKLLGRS
jgi:glycosyltransferase involved in cell wall biosynthesis